jgi:hypothetical protein
MPDVKSIIDAIMALAKIRVVVGVPEEKDARSDSPMGNAGIAYVHEFGSPAQNIPARPFLRPGISGSKSEWTPYLERAAKRAMAADSATAAEAAVTAELSKAGMVAANAVKNHIRAGIPPPLKAKSVKARQRRSKGSKYRRKALTPADVTPLIDTGTMLRSISYVLETKGKRSKPP